MFLIYINMKPGTFNNYSSWSPEKPHVKGSSWSYIVDIFGGSVKVQGDVTQELLQIIADINNIIEGSLICQLSKWCPD